jgi:hypothetical protein
LSLLSKFCGAIAFMSLRGWSFMLQRQAASEEAIRLAIEKYNIAPEQQSRLAARPIVIR